MLDIILAVASESYTILFSTVSLTPLKIKPKILRKRTESIIIDKTPDFKQELTTNTKVVPSTNDKTNMNSINFTANFIKQV